MSKFEIYHNYLNYLLLLHSPNEHKYISDVMILSLKENKNSIEETQNDERVVIDNDEWSLLSTRVQEKTLECWKI